MYLTNEACIQKDVSGGQVPVHKSLVAEVVHAGSNLEGTVQYFETKRVCVGFSLVQSGWRRTCGINTTINK